MKSILKYLPLVPLAAASSEPSDADIYQLGFQNWFYGPIAFVDNATEELFRNAHANPNATRSVKFKPFEGRAPQSSASAVPDWTWTVNVSDFAVPFAARENNTYVDPRTVTTVYSFDFGHDSNITEAMGNIQDPFCVTRIVRPKFPNNITNLYSENNTMNSDCRPVLGDSCVSAILMDDVVDRNHSSPDFGCNYPEPFWNRLPECSESLGYAGLEENGLGFITVNLNSNYTQGVETYESGQGFMGYTTGLHNATDESAYEDTVNHLQIMMVQTCLPDSSWSSGEVCRKHLLCMRVDTRMLETDDESGGQHGYSSIGWAGMLVVLAATFAML